MDRSIGAACRPSRARSSRPACTASVASTGREGAGALNVVEVVPTVIGVALRVAGVVLSFVCVVHHGFHAQQTEHRPGPRTHTPCYVRAMAESVVLDPVDLHLLRLLQNDARTTYRDLAAQVGVAPRPAWTG